MTFNGTWKVNSNDNYDKFMEQMDKFTVNESSAFRTVEIIFTLGVAFEYSLADGTELSGTWTMDGDKLAGKFIRKDNGKELLTVREIIAGELVQSYHYDGVDAKRVFKRV
ncbi:Fatty acid-binding protein, intestinal [Acipenser ruthenus]|uniref:Fatty acid-binding protein, intestinal n=1 Tax=Acipenser ruthenus TaxID=7906 RepID=A0A444UKW4_ACIRT|nr:Fatty acid-binding protein, intestinal [Acipenser ruthenus]